MIFGAKAKLTVRSMLLPVLYRYSQFTIF